MKILASDYDGTLRTGESVDLKDIKAIKAFRKAGNIFGIVTGRSLESIRQAQQDNQFEFDFIVANNGGVVYDHHFHKLKEVFMDFKQALRLIEYIKTISCISYVVNDGYRRCRIVVNPDKVDKKYGKLATSLTMEEVMEKQKIAQIVVSLDDKSASEKIAAEINQSFQGFACAYCNINCIDIVPYGVSKASGLLFVEQHLHLHHEDIYAIGDSYNDITMLDAFHGFCVAHANEDIKHHAEHCFIQVNDAIQYLLKK